MISGINFTGLHIPKTKENKSGLSRMIPNDVVQKTAFDTFETIDRKAGRKDVFLSVKYEKPSKKNDSKGQYELKISDTDGKKLTSVNILDSADKKAPDSLYTYRFARKMEQLASDMPNMGKPNVDKFFDTFA